MFTGDSSEKLRIVPAQVQIDTTHFRPQVLAKSGVSRTRLAVNRTAVVKYNKNTMTVSPGSSKSLARRLNDMQSLHGGPLLLMPAMCRQ
jgi:hypothetical protein